MKIILIQIQIVLYNLFNNPKISEIKNEHNDYGKFQFEILLNLIYINNSDQLEEACFLYYKNKNYFIT